MENLLTFDPIETPNVAASAAAQIRKLIANDVLRPGDQLPGERDLATQMGISRTSLRTGLQTLVAEGLLLSKHGSGLFVASDLGKSIVDPLISLMDSSPNSMFDYLSFRRMIEGQSAAFVAENATEAEKGHILEIHARLQEAVAQADGEKLQELDREFHMAIIETTGNVVSIQVTRSLAELLRSSVSQSHEATYGSSQGPQDILEQHQAIVDAIISGKPSLAQSALVEHLNHFEQLILKSRDAKERAEIVQKRTQWDAQN